MSIFKTYNAAVLVNGSVKGVYENLLTGWFQLDISHPGSWAECNPTNYLESLKDFLAGGKRLVDYDVLVDIVGSLLTVGKDVSAAAANSKSKNDDRRFILQAAADQMETPEEKEAFDRLAREHDNEANQAHEMCEDTTPQQYESLANTDWKHGDKCIFQNNGAIVVGWHPSHPVLIIDSDAFGLTPCSPRDLHKPESQADHEDRERLEAAYDLFLTASEHPSLNFDEFVKCSFSDSYLRIVDKTGYRKECKK